MAFDLIIRNATLPDGRKGQDVAIAAGRIAAIEPSLEAEARETIDAHGPSCLRPSSTVISTWTRPCRWERRA